MTVDRQIVERLELPRTTAFDGIYRWKQYAETLRKWQLSEASPLIRIMTSANIVVGFGFAFYSLLVIYPNWQAPLWIRALGYGFTLFAVVMAIFNHKGRYPYWHLAVLVQWTTFSLYLSVCIAYALLVQYSPDRSVFFGFWLLTQSVNGMLVFGSSRAAPFLAAPCLAHAVTVLIYFARLNHPIAGDPASDMLICGMAANFVALFLSFGVMAFRENYGREVARAHVQAAQSAQIAERRRVEIQLASAQLQLEQLGKVTTMSALAASIAHEINQPLAAIVTNASAAIRWLEAGETEEARRSLDSLITDGHRAGSVIAGVRALLSQKEPEHQSVDINAVVLDTVAMLDPEARPRGITILTKLGDALPLVAGDTVQLQQVLVNLISNGMDALDTLESGLARPKLIKIESRRNNRGEIVVNVEDTGPGVSAESQDRIFDPFYTTKRKGTGMGLSICRSILQTHKGDLTVLSSHYGAIFSMNLQPAQDKFFADAPHYASPTCSI